MRHLGEAGVYAVGDPVKRGRCGLLDTYPVTA